MASYKSVISSVRYHTTTRPAIHHVGKAIRSFFTGVKRGRKGYSPAQVAKQRVHSFTRGELADHPTAYSKKTMAGQTRRDRLAKEIKAHRKSIAPKTRPYDRARGYVHQGTQPKPPKPTIIKTKKVTTNKPPKPPKPPKQPTRAQKAAAVHGATIFNKHHRDNASPTALHQAVRSSKTHGELRTRMRNMAVRHVSQGLASKKGGLHTREAQAKAIRAGRKKHGPSYLKYSIKKFKHHNIEQAAHILHPPKSS